MKFLEAQVSQTVSIRVCFASKKVKIKDGAIFEYIFTEKNYVVLKKPILNTVYRTVEWVFCLVFSIRSLPFFFSIPAIGI